MRYQEVACDEQNRISYEFFEGDRKAGALSCRNTGNGGFLVDRITFMPGFHSKERLCAVFEFLEYKAYVSGKGTLYVRVSQKNVLYLEWLLANGFFCIDTEDELTKGLREERFFILRR